MSSSFFTCTIFSLRYVEDGTNLNVFCFRNICFFNSYSFLLQTLAWPWTGPVLLLKNIKRSSITVQAISFINICDLLNCCSCLPYWSLSWNINELGIMIIFAIVPNSYNCWEQINYPVQLFYKSQLYVIESWEEGFPCWKQSGFLSVEYFCTKL